MDPDIRLLVELAADMKALRYDVREVKQDVKDVHAEQKITNGRVNALESTSDRMKGAIGVLTALLVPLVIAFIVKYLL